MPCGSEHHIGKYNITVHTRKGIIGDNKRYGTEGRELSVTRAPTVSGAQGGEYHVGDYNAAGHAKNGIIGDLKKLTIQRRAGTIGDYSD